MFWLYLVFVLVPPICIYKYINRDGNGASEGLALSIGVLFVQTFLVLAGGAICTTIAILLFSFGLFLGYGAWYMPRLERKVVFKDGEVLHFHYTDARGNTTKRRVRVTSCDNIYVRGLCLDQLAVRTFRRSRVQGGIIIDSTGEIVDPMSPAHPGRT